MTIREMLVHVPATGETGPVIDLAICLAGKLRARLSALYTIRRLMMVTALFGRHSPVLADAARQEYARAQDLERAFLARAGSADVAAGWLVGEGDAAALVRRAGRLHDLIVVPQSSPATDEIGFDVSEHAVYRSGCPTLIVSRSGSVATTAEHVAVFWDAGRETALAVRSAMSVLAAARQVTILAAPERGSPDILRPAPFHILGYLSGHGIRAELKRIDPGAAHGFEAVLDSVVRHGADLLVAGAPEHALVSLHLTRHERPDRVLLHRSPLPVLLAH
jgi:hypothetical protein